ncbi:actin-like ATPase domain-containing protein, partial [Wilcoxina mikolae CBS 423.85]
LLTTILATLFTHFQCPSVTLMSSPVLAVVASGLRSGLVVDIGWEETIITPVYELRAIEGRGIGVHGRSRRAIKVLREKWTSFLTSFLAAQDDDLEPDLDEVEEIMERVGHVSPAAGGLGDDPVLTIPLSGHTLHIPFSSLSIPAEKAFFAPTTTPSDTPAFADDDDTPLPMLLYNVLLRSAIDVRAACVSRIMFVGGGAKIPGLQTRVLAELEGIVKERGWVLGRIGMDSNGTATNNAAETGNENRLEDVEEERDNLDPHHYQHHEDKENHRGRGEKPREKIEGEIRAVKSLGVWCGGSLVAGLKVRGKLEVERERFLSQISMGGTGLPSGW